MQVKIEDIAKLMGKKKWEIEEMLKSSDVIELNLSERKPRYGKQAEEDDLRIFE